jgi:hypothetical protein
MFDENHTVQRPEQVKKVFFVRVTNMGSGIFFRVFLCKMQHILTIAEADPNMPLVSSDANLLLESVYLIPNILGLKIHPSEVGNLPL